MKKVGSDQATLRLVQYGMRGERLFHFRGACLEDLKQIPVAAFEVVENLRQLSARSPGLQPKDSFDNMVGPGLVGRV